MPKGAGAANGRFILVYRGHMIPHPRFLILTIISPLSAPPPFSFSPLVIDAPPPAPSSVDN